MFCNNFFETVSLGFSHSLPHSSLLHSFLDCPNMMELWKMPEPQVPLFIYSSKERQHNVMFSLNYVPFHNEHYCLVFAGLFLFASKVAVFTFFVAKAFTLRSPFDSNARSPNVENMDTSFDRKILFDNTHWGCVRFFTRATMGPTMEHKAWTSVPERSDFWVRWAIFSFHTFGLSTSMVWFCHAHKCNVRFWIIVALSPLTPPSFGIPPSRANYGGNPPPKSNYGGNSPPSPSLTDVSPKNHGRRGSFAAAAQRKMLRWSWRLCRFSFHFVCRGIFKVWWPENCSLMQHGISSLLLWPLRQK